MTEEHKEEAPKSLKHTKMNKSLSKLTKVNDLNKYDQKYEEVSAGMMALLNLNDPKWKIDKRWNSPLIE